MTRPGLRGVSVTGGGAVAKSQSQPSPRRHRARLNSRGSVLHQVTLFDFIAQHAQQSSPQEQGQTGPPLPGLQDQHQQGQVDPLVQQLGSVHLEERPAAMDVQENRVVNVSSATQSDKIDLTDRVDPAVPGPLPQVRQDEEGWGEIDKLGA